MKSTPRSNSKPLDSSPGAAKPAGTKAPSGHGSPSAVLMSIPEVRSVGDQLFSQRHLEDSAPNPVSTAPGTPKVSIVAISAHEASGLQLMVQGAKQRFVDLMGGSVFWRLFVGSGVAIFIGSATLLLLSPNAEQVASGDTNNPLTGLHEVHPEAAATEKGPADPVANSAVELTVSTTTNGNVPVPAEFDDPFRIENQVTPKAIPAVHFTESQAGLKPANIQPVSQVRITVDQPAWLAGTIDVEEDGDSGQLKRKHERSRPSNR